MGSSSQCSSFEISTITLASSEDGGAVHISPRQSLTLLFNQLSSPPSQDLLVEDLVALNIPQIHDSPVDIYIFIYAYPSLSLATVISRIVALALPYDNYAMYAFTYASANIPSVRSTIPFSCCTVCKSTILSTDNIRRSRTDVDGRSGCVR